MKYAFTLLITPLLLSACTTVQELETDTSDTERITIAAGFYPLAHFARQVAGDLADVRQVLPPGAEPHHYEPTPQEMTLLTQADVILLNGADLMGWEESAAALPEVQDSVIITMADHVPLRPMLEEKHEEEEEEAHEEEEHADHGMHDPHFWLDPVIAIQEVELIRDALQQIDPIHAETYARNAETFMEELRTLDADFRSGLQNCALDTIVVGHDSFGYAGERYGFHSLAIAGVHGGELSARTIAEITDAVQTLGIKHVFTETLTSPKITETVARETGAETLMLDTIHGLTRADRQDEGYLTLMRDNLRNLRIALQCP